MSILSNTYVRSALRRGHIPPAPVLGKPVNVYSSHCFQKFLNSSFVSPCFSKIEAQELMPRALSVRFRSHSFHYSSMIEKHSQFHWDMRSLLRLHVTPNCDKYAFLVLNRRILDPETTLLYWKNASFRMAIDGGGNEVLDLLRKFRLDDHDELLPHVVSGDFDSIRSEVLTVYKNRKVKIISTPNQDETDFYKGLREAVSLTKVSIFMVLCETSGRFDQVMSNVNILFKALKQSNMKHLKIFLLSSITITWLLQPGYHTLQIPRELWNEKSICSLIPVGQPCLHVTTTGLKWNLKDDVLQFGDIVSTSNTYDVNQPEAVVTVQIDNHLIWSMSINRV